jgi:hypothetical protein
MNRLLDWYFIDLAEGHPFVYITVAFVGFMAVLFLAIWLLDSFTPL